jgi:hypothetical protein
MASLPKYGNHINDNCANHRNWRKYESVCNHKNDSNDNRRSNKFSIGYTHTHSHIEIECFEGDRVHVEFYSVLKS